MTEVHAESHQEHAHESHGNDANQTEKPAGKEKKITFELNLKFFAKHWVFFTLIAVFALSFYARTSSFNYPYLLNVDSYFQYRYIQFVVNGGIPPVDYYMLAPQGIATGLSTGVSNIYHYIAGYSYILTRLAMPGLELWRFLIYFPAFLASLMVIPAYIIGNTIYDKKAGILMAFLVVLSPTIFMRTLGGDPDTDSIVMIMPLIVMAFFVLSMASLQKINTLKNRRALVLSLMTGIFLAAFAFTWSGYWYILFLIGGVVFGKILIDIILSVLGDKNHKNILKDNTPLFVNFVIMLVVFFLLTTPIYGLGFITTTLSQPLGATNLKAETGNFPNVFVSVQEMMAGGSIKDVVQNAGVIFFLLTYIICLPYLVGSYIKNKHHMETMILILLWSLGALFASVFAVRFSILLAVPLALGSAITLAKVWRLALGEDKGLFE